ncbi:hypothetical protein LR48_Vigan04g145600 [Vigna angularis]|uniref:Uncharacterized protein n=1 Tax=Phaseolus angularis TaxID=3914 RepID=A0A0L9UEU3_PHAAN|nr:hypothetical protein LR48_Vigan04g145600 [Vigna angularis]
MGVNVDVEEVGVGGREESFPKMGEGEVGVEEEGEGEGEGRRFRERGRGEGGT